MGGQWAHTACMERASSCGVTEEAMKVNIATTRMKGLVCSSGPMAGNMKVSGRTANNMVRELTRQRRVTNGMASGMMAGGHAGNLFQKPQAIEHGGIIAS